MTYSEDPSPRSGEGSYSSNPNHSSSGYASAFQIYRDKGWPAIKLKAGTKFPPPKGFTGRDGVDPSYADQQAWADEEPNGNLAIRMPAGVIGIDVDNYGSKRGKETLEEAERRWGPLPLSPLSTSRDDGVSGIKFYRTPEGTELVDRIEFTELGLGDIEIIQPHHRYAVVSPSIHPNGRPYEWPWPGDPPPVDELPKLPPTWFEALQAPSRPDSSAEGAESLPNGLSVLTEGEPSDRVKRALADAVLALGHGSRHDNTRDNVLALLRLGKQGHPGVKEALARLLKVFAAQPGKTADEFYRFVFNDTRDDLNDRVKRELSRPSTAEDYIPPPDEPPPPYDDYPGEWTAPEGNDNPRNSSQDQDRTGEPQPEETTWEPIDIGPWLNGERTTPEPALGISRADGQKLLYRGLEHTVFGETEAGKSWFALECAAVEMRMGRDVVIIHYEESDPGSTLERLKLLGVTAEQIRQHLRFVAPARPVRGPWLEPLLNPPPVLVIHDGVNEAMSLHDNDTNATDGAATFRRNVIKPFLAVGAASLSCDHVVKNSENRGRYAIGSAHKVNAINGAAFLMENIEPFGRGLRGASAVYVTKDRPGQLRAHGKAEKIPGKTLIGVLTVDATGDSPDFLVFWPPREGSEAGTPADKATFTTAEIADMVYDIVNAEPDRSVDSRKTLFAKMRLAGNGFRDDVMRQAADMLVASGRLVEVNGRRGATGYRVSATSSQTSSQENGSSPSSPRPTTSSHTSSPIDGDEVGRGRDVTSSRSADEVGRGGTRSTPEGGEAA